MLHRRSKSKTYSVSIKSGEHAEQMAFQESEYFKAKAKERCKIEAKNSELKHRHGYDIASSSGLIGMELQGAMAILTVNLKRILKLMSKKRGGMDYCLKKTAYTPKNWECMSSFFHSCLPFVQNRKFFSGP